MGQRVHSAKVVPCAWKFRIDIAGALVRFDGLRSKSCLFKLDAAKELDMRSVELTGACISCPISTITLKDGIERILKERIDGVTAVEHVGSELAGGSVDGGTAVSIGSTVVSPLAPPAATS